MAPTGYKLVGYLYERQHDDFVDDLMETPRKTRFKRKRWKPWFGDWLETPVYAALSPAREPTGTDKPRRVRHMKRGSTYTVIGEGRLQTSEPLSDMVHVTIYRSDEDGSLWARPVGEFDDGRFEELP